MSWQEDRRNAGRAGIAVAFFLFGASIVIGAQMDADSLPALVLGLTAPVTAVLAGVVTGRTAGRVGGAR